MAQARTAVLNILFDETFSRGKNVSCDDVFAGVSFGCGQQSSSYQYIIIQRIVCKNYPIQTSFNNKTVSKAYLKGTLFFESSTATKIRTAWGFPEFFHEKQYNLIILFISSHFYFCYLRLIHFLPNKIYLEFYIF